MFTKEIENTSAISISEQFLLDLEEIIKKYFANIYYIATLKNKKRKAFNTMSELCAFENALEKRIVKLEISAYSDKNESVHLFFEDREKTSVRGIVSTSDEKVTNTIYEEIDYAMRRKAEDCFFTYVARINYCELLCLILLLWLMKAETTPSNKESIGLFLLLNRYFVPLIVVLGAYMCFVWVLYQIKKKFFPMIVFEIGDEIVKNEKRKALKKNLMWAGVFAIMASVIGSFIYAKITNG